MILAGDSNHGYFSPKPYLVSGLSLDVHMIEHQNKLSCKLSYIFTGDLLTLHNIVVWMDSVDHCLTAITDDHCITEQLQ